MRFLLLLACGVATPLAAQGTLSTQGFGYHPGQVSTRARAAGGSLGEFDPTSALNPAALAWWERSGVVLEYAPEFRRVITAGASESATVARFPLSGAAIAIGNRTIIGITLSPFSTAWQTTQRDTQAFADDAIPYVLAFRVPADQRHRVAGAWTASRAVRSGLEPRVLWLEPPECRTQFDDTLGRSPTSCSNLDQLLRGRRKRRHRRRPHRA